MQNLSYDESLQRWFLGVYQGKKKEFPNYTLFAVDARTRPVLGDLGLGHVVGVVSPGVWGTDGYVAPEVLLGAEQGPRFGGFVALYGIPETVALIEAALAGRLAA